jgi:hypothetical protein
MRLSPRWAIGLLLVTALAALMPIAALAAPSAQGGKPYGGKVLQSFVNCGITQVFGVVVDESGNALPGMGVRLWWGGGEVHTTAGTYVRPETNAAGWDFTLNTVNVENTWYVAVEDAASNTLLSDPVAVQTTGHCDAANSANAVKVELRRGAAGSTPAPAPQQPSNPAPAPQQPSGTASGDQAPALTSGATCQTISQTGYQVCDDANARFLAAYQRYGAQNIGYPISTRYSRDGFITQAFQKAILQWRPESNSAAFANVFDDLSRAGMDQRLYETRQTPFQLPSGWEGVNVPFAEAVRLRQGLLSNRPAMRTTYFAASDPLTFFGLPTSEVTDMGNHYAIRLQRAVLQEWKENVPWARAGQVTIANGGDIAKELGLIPGFALTNTTNSVAMSAPASNAPTTFAAPVPAAPAPAAPVPAAPAPAAPVPAASEPGRNIDPVFSQLGGGIVPANVAPGQAYWRVVSIEWHDEAESGGRHAIQFNTVDEGGSRVAGTPITISWGGGSSTITMEAKPGEPFGANFPMYVDGPSYSARVDGLPSDVVTGMGLGTPETPYLTIHTEYYITWQRVVKR